MFAEEIKSLTSLFEAEQAKRAAECSSWQDKLLSAEQQQEGLRQQLLLSISQTDSLKQQEQQAKQALAQSSATQAELLSSQAILQQRCANLQAQVVESQHTTSNSLQSDPAEVFQLLEKQLMSLSGLLKQKEQQVAALQQTVQQQCDERTAMQIKIMQLQSSGIGDCSKQSPAATAEQKGTWVNQSGPGHNPAGPGHNPADANTSPRVAAPAQASTNGNMADLGKAAQRSNRLHRLASASEQQQGKSGLLGRIMATSSKTGRVVYDC